MSQRAGFNFYVLTDIPGKEVLHVSVSETLLLKLTEEFRKQRDEFLKEREVIEFRAAYHPTQEEIFEINPFKDPKNILAMIKSPSSVESLEHSSDALEHVIAFFSTSDNPHELLFQNFDKRRIISHGKLAIIWDKNTYQYMEEPGLSLNSSLGAVLNRDSLLFHSVWNANRIFDLKSYLKDATDEQVAQFLTHKNFVMEDPKNPLDKFDGLMRTKICLILDSGVLDLSPQVLKNHAAGLDYDLQIDETGRTIIPKEKKLLKQLLKILSEDIILSPLTETLQYISSKRPI